MRSRMQATPGHAGTAPRSAAVVIVLRPGPAGRDEVYWVRRSRRMQFLPGFHTFPGGKVGPGDGSTRWAALRELFEEAGVLLARGAVLPAAENLQRERRALLGGARTFGELLAALGVSPDEEALRPAGRWVTPPFSPIRFDTEFFVARVPAETPASVTGDELDDGEWIAAGEGVARWNRGEVLLAPPTLFALREIARGTDDGLEERLRSAAEEQGGTGRRIDMAPGVVLVPLRSPTLPPATHTNCVFLGSDRLLVVDPGSPYPDEQEALDAVIEALEGEGRTVGQILLTHHHVDHVAGAARVAERTGAPIVAHDKTARALPDGPRVDRMLVDGETFSAGSLGGVRALHTPGHTAGHVAFYCEKIGLLLAGDLVAGVGTVIVDPSDGDMIDYLESLKRIGQIGARAILPAHGPALWDAAGALEDLIEHRYMREGKVLEALRRGDGRTAGAILPEVYDDTPERQWPFAVGSLESHLRKLEREGRIRRDGAKIFLT